MDDAATLRIIRHEAAGLAAAATDDLHRTIPSYPGWSMADLVVHTGRIHRWVTHIIETRATRRPPQPDIDERPSDLIAWFESGATAVADTLAGCSPSLEVWTFAGEPTVRFWRRRMALETTIHRWDAQRAAGHAAPIADDVAVAGVTEALEIYVEPRSRGTAIGGNGEVAVLRTTDGQRAWVLRLHAEAIEFVDTDHTRVVDRPGDVLITATPDQLWLFLMGRLGGDALQTDGAGSIGNRLEQLIAALPPPAR